jgi:hypothetical protein
VNPLEDGTNLVGLLLIDQPGVDISCQKVGKLLSPLAASVDAHLPDISEIFLERNAHNCVSEGQLGEVDVLTASLGVVDVEAIDSVGSRGCLSY